MMNWTLSHNNNKSSSNFVLLGSFYLNWHLREIELQLQHRICRLLIVTKNLYVCVGHTKYKSIFSTKWYDTIQLNFYGEAIFSGRLVGWTRTAKFKCTKTVLLSFGQMSLVCNGRNVTREIFVIIQCAFVLTTWHIFPTFSATFCWRYQGWYHYTNWFAIQCEFDTLVSTHFFVYAIHRPYTRYTHIKLLFIPMQIISIKIITSKTFAGKCFAFLMESKWCVENSVFIVCVEYWIRIVSIVFCNVCR